MTPAEMARIHAAAFPNRRVWGVDEFAGLIQDTRVTLAHRPHGFALARTVVGEAEVLTVAVDPTHQGQGIGAAVMAALLAQTPAQTAFLEVADNNLAAIALYQRCGFATVGHRRAYYTELDGTQRDALVMRLNLSTDDPASLPKA